MMDMYHGARRANRGGGLVQISGDLGLFTAFCFWAWVLWGFVHPQFTTPENAVTLGTVITGVFLAMFAVGLALCCAFVMPALCSAIFPHTTAAMYLQEIRRSNWGFWLLCGAFSLLAMFACYILTYWWQGRLVEVDPATGVATVDIWLVRSLTAMSLIFFVVVPSWASNYGTPILWLTEVQQAHQVERLKMTHKQSIAMAKASYRRALNILKAGLDSATVEQREYAAGVLIGLHQAERSLMLEIADTLDEDARIEGVLPTYDDPKITQGYQQLHQLLVAGTPVYKPEPEAVDYVDTEVRGGVAEAPRSAGRRWYDDLPDDRAQERGSHQDAAPADLAVAPQRRAGEVSPQRPAAPRSAPQRYAAEYAGAREKLAEERFWNVRRLAEALGEISERSARERMDAWVARGLVRPAETKGQYYFTEWDEQQAISDRRESEAA